MTITIRKKIHILNYLFLDSGNIEQRTESPQATSIPVDLEQDKASGKQGSRIEEASDDDSTNNQESGERICFFCDRNRKYIIIVRYPFTHRWMKNCETIFLQLRMLVVIAKSKAN